MPNFGSSIDNDNNNNNSSSLRLSVAADVAVVGVPLITSPAPAAKLVARSRAPFFLAMWRCRSCCCRCWRRRRRRRCWRRVVSLAQKPCRACYVIRQSAQLSPPLPYPLSTHCLWRRQQRRLRWQHFVICCSRVVCFYLLLFLLLLLLLYL